MEVINSTEPFEPNIEVWEEGFKPLPKKETEKRYSDIYDEPMYFFKGTVIAFFFCLPFWTILLWLITWLLIGIHFLNLDEVKRSDCFLLSPK